MPNYTSNKDNHFFLCECGDTPLNYFKTKKCNTCGTHVVQKLSCMGIPYFERIVPTTWYNKTCNLCHKPISIEEIKHGYTEICHTCEDAQNDDIDYSQLEVVW